MTRWKWKVSEYRDKLKYLERYLKLKFQTNIKPSPHNSTIILIECPILIEKPPIQLPKWLQIISLAKEPRLPLKPLMYLA